MKQYLLIPTEEISKEIKNQVSKIPNYINDIEDSYIKGECEHIIHLLQHLQSKGEVVKLDGNETITELFHSTRPFGTSIGEFIESKGYKLIKKV